MTLGELEKLIQTRKQVLIEEFNWTEEALQKVEVYVCVQDEEGGIHALLNDISVDAPPLTFYLTGQLASSKYRIVLEDIND